MTVPSEDDVSWLRRVAAWPLTREPLGDYGVLVKRMLECGVSEYEIARFAKIVGYETAFNIAYLLDDPAAGFQAPRIQSTCHGACTKSMKRLDNRRSP